MKAARDKGDRSLLLAVDRMIESMPEAVLVIDQPGVVVAVNQAAVDLLDLADRAAAIRPLDEYGGLIHSWRIGDQAFAPTDLRRALAGEVIPRQTATITTAAGVERVVEFTATPVRDEAGTVRLAMLVAVDRTREWRGRAYWRAVGTAARGVSGGLDVGQVLETVLDQLFEALAAEVVIGVWRLDEANGGLTLLTQRGTSEEHAAQLRFLPLDSQTLICEAVRTRQVRYSEDTHRAPLPYDIDRHLVESEGLGSWVAAPLLAGGRPLGAMAYGLHASHRFYEEDLQAVTVVSGLFADALDRALLHEEVWQVNQRLVVAGVREQEQAEEAERQTAQLRALLESLTEGVAILDATGRVVLTNPVGREMTRWPEQPGQEQAWTLEDYRQLDVRRPDGTPLPFEERPITRALRGERFVDYEALVVHADGSQHRLVYSGSAVRDEESRVELAIVVFRDVSELRELERTKEEFTSLISHDLRSPLAALRGHAQMLQRTLTRKGLGQEAASAEAIVRSASRMNSMIQELVESSRLEAGRLEMRKEKVDLCHLLLDIVERVGSANDRARLQMECPESTPSVLADPERLERAIVNLLTNALKYSEATTPVVVRIAPSRDEVVVSVIDQGVGIPAEDLPHLFERFYRAKTAGKAEGLGLGLYITRLILEAHGGRIWVESQVGKGSTFRFNLPLA